MKVLVLNKMYYPDIGGVETVVKQYAEFLSSNSKFKVTVLTANANQRLKISKEIIDNIEVIRCPSFGMYFSMPISFSILYMYLKILKDYDTVHIHEPYPIGSLLLLFTKKKKKIITYHCDIVKQSGILKRIVNYIQRKNLCNATTITTTSSQLLSNSKILKPYKNKTKIIPLSTKEKYLNITFNSDYFLIIGRLSYYKGLEVLISSINAGLEIKRRILVVGKGETEIENKLLELDAKNKIEFLNRFVSEKEKNKLIENCYALIFPSTYNSEAFGIIQIEAMRFGKPIINTSLDTAVPWVSVDKITGLTVKPGNALELTQAITRLDKFSKENYKQYCENSYSRFQAKFNDTIAKNNLLKIYQELS